MDTLKLLTNCLGAANSEVLTCLTWVETNFDWQANNGNYMKLIVQFEFPK